MKNNYTFPHDFDPHHAIYALKGLADLLFEYHTEGPGVFRTLPAGEHVNLVGLAWLNRRVAHELNDYLAALDEEGHRLPGKEDFEEGGVRDERGEYRVGRVNSVQ